MSYGTKEHPERLASFLPFNFLIHFIGVDLALHREKSEKKMLHFLWNHSWILLSLI